MVAALDRLLSTPKHIIIAGDPDAPDTKAMRRLINRTFDPLRVIIYADGKEGQSYLKHLGVDSILEESMTIEGKATVYICQNFLCNAPTTEIEQLENLLLYK